MAAVFALFCGQARADQYEDAMAAFTRADYPRTLELLRPLLEQGDPRAQSLLGVMYDFGNSVAKNPTRATELYTEAANPKTAHDAFAATLTPEQIAEADRQAYAWMAQHRK